MSLPPRSLRRRPALHAGALGAGLSLAACPQLLEDGFEERLAPPVGLTSSGGTPGGGFAGSAQEPDASLAGAAGDTVIAAGAGGAPSVAGAGGVASAVDAGQEPGAGAGSGGSGDSGTPSGPGAVLRAALLHRYRFDEAGTIIFDSIGGAHATASNAQVAAGSGKIVLAGADEYVDLPNGLLSGLSSVTLEAWVNWTADPTSSAADWQTVFTLGSNDAGEGSQGMDGTSYVHLTAKAGDSGDLRAGYTLTGYAGELLADGDDPLPLSQDATRGTQIVLVIRGSAEGGSLAVYVEGALEAASAGGAPVNLSAIADVNNWLGRSQFSSDPHFTGEFLEFRVYGSALSASDVALSHALGPDATL